MLTDIVITSVAHGSYPLRLVREIGQPMPASTTAVGRALMTYLSNDEIVQRSRAHVGDMADGGIVSRVDIVREHGVAWSKSAIIPGIAALACAISDPRRGESMGLSISYPTSAANAELRMRMLHRLGEEASAIGIASATRSGGVISRNGPYPTSPLSMRPSRHGSNANDQHEKMGNVDMTQQFSLCVLFSRRAAPPLLVRPRSALSACRRRAPPAVSTS